MGVIYVTELKRAGRDSEGHKINVYGGVVKGTKVTGAASGANRHTLDDATKYVRIKAAGGNSVEIGVSIGTDSVVASASGASHFTLGAGEVIDYALESHENYVDCVDQA